MSMLKKGVRISQLLMTSFLLVLFLALPAYGMQLFVKTPQDKMVTLEVEPADSIISVKNKIEEKENVTPAEQRLYFGDVLLEDDKTLQDYSVQKDSNLILKAVASYAYDDLTTKTASIKQAIDLANEHPDGTLTLLEDCTPVETLKVKATYTIDLNGHKITRESTEYFALIEVSSGSLTLINGSDTPAELVATNTANQGVSAMKLSDGTLTIGRKDLNGKISFKGVSNGSTYAIYAGGGDLNIVGGTNYFEATYHALHFRGKSATISGGINYFIASRQGTATTQGVWLEKMKTLKNVK